MLAYKDRNAIGISCEFEPKPTIITETLIGCTEYLLQKEDIYGHPKQLKLIRKYVDQVLLLRKTWKDDNRDKLKSEISRLNDLTLTCGAPKNWVIKTIGHAYQHIVFEEVPSYVALITGLVSFEECTMKEYLCESLIQKDEIISTAMRPKLQAPQTAVLAIAKHLQIDYIDHDFINKHSTPQSLTQLQGKFEGFYNFYKKQRYQLLSEKKNSIPLFHGQEENHEKLELDVLYLQQVYNNTLAKSFTPWNGSLQNEQCHQMANVHMGINKGFVNLKGKYLQLSRFLNHHNQKKIEYWTKRNWLDRDDEKIPYDDETIQKMNLWSNKLYNATHVIHAFKNIGYYQFNTTKNDEYLTKWVKEKVEKDKLIFKKKKKWTNQHDLYLFHKLESKPSGWKLTRKNVSEFVEMFYNMFDTDFIIRRCETWDFYLAD